MGKLLNELLEKDVINDTDLVPVTDENGVMYKYPFGKFNDIEEGELTRGPNSGTTGNFDLHKCYKRNGVATIEARLYSGNFTSMGTMFVVPEGFRPKKETHVNGYVGVSSGLIPAIWDVYPSGNVYLNYSSGTTGNQLYVAGSYLCE